jgi:hypothetical protein
MHAMKHRFKIPLEDANSVLVITYSDFQVITELGAFGRDSLHTKII